jgi:hypothetical protein
MNNINTTKYKTKVEDKYNKYTYQKGQTLLFVIVGVTIALAIGIAVSTRTLSSLRRAARSDTSARVIAAAEAGIENLLSKPDSLLISASTPSDSSCEGIGATYNNDLRSCVYILSKGESQTPPPDNPPQDPKCEECMWEEGPCGKPSCADKEMLFTYRCTPPGCQKEPETKCVYSTKCGGDGIGDPTNPIVEGEIEEEGQDINLNQPASNTSGSSNSQDGDKIPSRAVVSISTFNKDEHSDGYSFILSPGNVKEVVLDGYAPNTIQICFNNPNTAIYYFSYNKSGETLKSGIYPNTPTFPYKENLKRFQQSNTAKLPEYKYCINADLVKGNTKYGLRLKALYEESKVAVFPTQGASLPTQGFLFVSRGELSTGKGSDEVATVKVRKSYSYVSDIFDYGIYSPSDISGVGN